jgi:transcription termination factor Rho
MVHDDTSSTDTDALPFGSFGPGPSESSKKKRTTKKKRASKKASTKKASTAKSAREAEDEAAPRTTKKRSKKAVAKKTSSKKTSAKKVAKRADAEGSAATAQTAARRDESLAAKPAASKKTLTRKKVSGPTASAKSASDEREAPERRDTGGAQERNANDEAERDGEGGDLRKDWRRPANRRGSARRGGRRRGVEPGEALRVDKPSADSQRARATAEAHEAQLAGSEGVPTASKADPSNAHSANAQAPEVAVRTPYSQPLMKKSRFAPAGSKPKAEAVSKPGGKSSRFKPKAKPDKPERPEPAQTICEGMLITDKGGHGKLRQLKNMFLPDRKDDVHLGPQMIQRLGLRDGSMIKGRFGKGFGKHKWDLLEVFEVDGLPPAEAKNTPDFKKLVSIDPDFHYALGDLTDDTCLRVIDLICPVGRGTRGLLVAPPRAGKTTLMKKFAQGLEKHYPDVKLMVLLVDERPEEATDWKRSIASDVFVSTNDEGPKNHVELAEAVWARCQRLVELGEEVVLLMDSITRLARAYNHVKGDSGKTMSGGVDARAMERPKQFFGAARNTESAGSLTILGTTLIETGSRMDQVIFEEFKGTGNMELVLSRKLADRRIFPAIDVERSGTRKEEKLVSEQRLRRMTTLRRVLARMHWAEAMELLISKLDDVEKNDDFLARFEVDPEA